MIDFLNLPRWIYASASIKVRDSADSAITFYEGLDRDSQPQEGAEFRMDGPRFRNIHSGHWELWVAINILIQVTMDDGDFHRRHVLAGKIVNALAQDIPVYKFGDGPDDNREEFIGCLILQQDKLNQIKVNHFGQIDKTNRLEQATVEAHYILEIKEET